MELPMNNRELRQLLAQAAAILTEEVGNFKHAELAMKLLDAEADLNKEAEAQAKTDPVLLNLVQGVMTLCSCGGEHEIGRNQDLCDGMDLIAECENATDGVTLTLENGDKYKVSVTKL